MTKVLKKEYHPVPTLDHQGQLASTFVETANLLADQFERIHTIDLQNNTDEQKQTIKTVKEYMKK